MFIRAAAATQGVGVRTSSVAQADSAQTSLDGAALGSIVPIVRFRAMRAFQPFQPFHRGELELQALTGEQAIAKRNAAVLAPELDHRAGPFLEAQRMIVIGSMAEDGWPQASVLFGPAGFVSAVDETSVLLRLEAVARNDDPVWANLRTGAALALLAIELPTRRRYRINGVIEAYAEQQVLLRVREAYANCPKYIRPRQVEVRALGGHEQSAQSGRELDDARRAFITSCETFFVASVHTERGLDVSHRGGPPGFIELVSPTRLRIPDYAGNSLFNTLGNLRLDPRAGLILVNFATGRALSITGRAEIVVGEGAERFWLLELERWQER